MDRILELEEALKKKEAEIERMQKEQDAVFLLMDLILSALKNGRRKKGCLYDAHDISCYPCTMWGNNRFWCDSAPLEGCNGETPKRVGSILVRMDHRNTECLDRPDYK